MLDKLHEEKVVKVLNISINQSFSSWNREN